MAAVASFAARSEAQWALDKAMADALHVDGKRTEAIMLYRALLAEQPDHATLHFDLGYALFLQSLLAPSDDGEGRRLRLESRDHVKRARDAGIQVPLADRILSSMRPDGSLVQGNLSQSAAAQSAMEEGQAAFLRRDLSTAFSAYQRALATDPQLYLAALFSGNCLFVEGKYPEAIVWFQRAIAIDPDQETAYRYWGDALVKQGDYRGALERHAEAFVAWPYSGLAWQALTNVARQTGRLRPLPGRDLPQASISREGDQTQIGLPPTPGMMTVAYALARAKWVDEQAKLNPGEPFRNTLAEETAGLRALTTLANELRNAPDPSEAATKELKALQATIDQLNDLDRDGLLESFILYLRANEGIAGDYAAYRRDHRERLREFVRRHVVNLD